MKDYSGKKKTLITLYALVMALLVSLTVIFIVLKAGETPKRSLYDVYNRIGGWIIVAWQMVVIAGCIVAWKKIFDSPKTESKLVIGIGRTLCVIFSIFIIYRLFLAQVGLIFNADNGGNAVLEKDEYILAKKISWLDDDYYSVWKKDGPFYRLFVFDIGFSEDGAAKAVFSSIVNGYADNTGYNLEAEKEDDKLSAEQENDYKLLNKFIEITERTYPDKYQRMVYWEEKECADNSIGVVQIPILEENGTQDQSWFCENIRDWLEDCLNTIPYEDAPWLYEEIIVAMPAVNKSFDISPYMTSGYDRDALYEALYDFVDKELTSADYPTRNNNYGMLVYEDGGSDEFIPSVEPECSYTTEDGTVYGMIPVDRAGGSSYYCFMAYKKGSNEPVMVNDDPYCGSGGQAKWIEFIDDSNLGFSCLTYNGGDDAILYRTTDGGKTFTPINYPSAKVKLSDGTIYNPFTIPEKVWVEDEALYMLAGQSQWSGDYYSEELGKHPSGLYVSHNDGLSFEYVGEQ